MLATRFGDRSVLLAASLVVACCWGAALAVATVPLLGVVVFVAGVSSAAFNVARQSYLVEMVPVSYRARVMSTLGGVGRVGLLVGPLLGAAAQTQLGIRGAYLVGAVATAAAGLVVLSSPRHPGAHGGGAGLVAGPARRSSFAVVARRNAAVLLTVGGGAAVIASGRSLRPLLIPLWASQVGA